jgi:hypothetical protein
MEVSMNLKKACLSLLLAFVFAPPVCQGGKHHTTITWDRSADKYVVGFNIYRGDDQGKENSLPVAKLVASECCKKRTLKCKWEDYDVVTGAKHCYLIKAVLKSGKIMDVASNETCSVTP